MTRISSIEQFQQGIDNILRQQERLNESQLKLATGKSINKPSDDPSAATQLLKLSAITSNINQYERNIESARNQLELQESVMANITNVLQRVRELVVQANSAAQSDESRAVIADELRNRIDELLQYGNTKDPDGEYIFSGYNARTAAFVKTASGFNFQGDQGERLLQISEDTQIAVRTNGAELFQSMNNGDGRFVLVSPDTNDGNALINMTTSSNATSDDYTLTFTQANPTDPVTYTITGATSGVVKSGTYESGSAISFNGVTLDVSGTPSNGDSYQINASSKQDIFSTVLAIAEVLEAGTETGAAYSKQANDLGQALNTIDQAFVHVQSKRTSIGNSLQGLDLRNDENADALLRTQKQISELEDLDYAQAVTQLNLQSVALQAAQQSYIKIQGLSLFNFLR